MTKDLLGLKDLSAEEINLILDTAEDMKKTLSNGGEKLSCMQGKNVVTLFYENSTRTRMSFEAAAKRLGAGTSSVSVASSSVQKGETLIDTGRNLDALLTDVIIIRHPVAGAPALLAKNVKASVVNGGDGMNEHPTQALLDLFTMRERYGRIQGLNVAICGDIKYSRVARSNIWALKTLGARVAVCAPKTLLPAGIAEFGVRVAHTPREALDGADVVMGLRIQTERQKGGMFPSAAEYARFFGIGMRQLSAAKKGALIMHPGPANRGVEMSSEVIDSPDSVILHQVTNGLAVRMAVLKLLTEGSGI